MKKINKFKSINYWKPIKKDSMQACEKSVYAYVRHDDYELLLNELAMERLRLKKAGDMISKLISNSC